MRTLLKAVLLLWSHFAKYGEGHGCCQKVRTISAVSWGVSDDELPQITKALATALKIQS
jgi:hypothetical protein